ncbi:MAG TPA: BTAD domain-containing putative transcriptional regulator [Burkholderiaceae bacterium]|nr:BTAD domain-containing putative transcriptional regulator [Burkholderiaceae bacterium]
MRISILGGLRLRDASGQALQLPTRKTALLLAALALAGDKGVRREALCAAFWPDRAEAQARGSLRHALAALRRAFPESAGVAIGGDLDRVNFTAAPDDVDAWIFERLAASAEPQALARAAALYGGDLLADIALPEPLDQWFVPHQRACRRKALQLVEQLSLVSDADLPAIVPEAEGLADRLLTSDAAAEEAHRALIRLHVRQGRITAARRQLAQCIEALQREVGATPEPATVALLDASGDVVSTAIPAAPAARERSQPSVVVMPFDNLSGEADAYFAEGVVEEITSALSRVREFFVIARQSAFAYKGRFHDVREVGRELGVRYVVEGTVRRGGDRLRISVQLVDAETRAQLWSDRCDGAVADVFAFQDRIAAQVAGAINPAVRAAEIDTAQRKPPSSLRAYDLVLQAYPRIWSQSAADNRQAIGLLEKATTAAPRYGRAHALLAWLHSQDVVYLWSADPEKSRRNVRAAIDAAAALIVDDPTALAAVGAAISQCLDDLDRAASYVEAALSLDPNNAWAWARYGWIGIYREQPDQATESFERALTLSPLDPLAFNLRIGIACALGARGEYATAARQLREVLNKHPHVTWAYRQLAYLAALAGDLSTARDAMARLRAAHPNISIALMRDCHPSRHTPGKFDVMLKGWRMAGMPEA